MKKIFSIVLLLLVSFMMFVPSRVLGEDKQNSNATTGHTVEEVGMQIATWAIQFCNDEDAGKYTCLYNDNTNDDNGSPRSIAYNAQIAEGSTYEFDCVGWVSFAVHHATGIGNESFTIFASPTRYGWNSYNFNRGFYEEIWRNDAGVNGLPRDVTVLPGDILVMDGHVGLYVGKNSQGEDMVADMWSTASGGLGIRSAYTFSNCRGSQDNLKQIGRITEEAAKAANFEFIADGVYLPGSMASTSNSAGDFEFNGMPTQVSYSKRKDLAWLFNQISQFFGFFGGMIINVIKFAALGYVIMFQSLANNFINASGESLTNTTTTNTTANLGNISYAYVKFIDDNSLGLYKVEEKEYSVMPIEALTGVNGSSQNSNPNASISGIVDGDYTIEDIIYNNIPLLDVNVFTDTPRRTANSK